MRFTLPEKGMAHEKILGQLEKAKKDDLKWHLGKSFCLVYYPGKEISDLVKEAYNAYFTENALNPISFPSLKKFESEIIQMMLSLLNAPGNACGSFTSGGTESILMAVKTARDYSYQTKPQIAKPEIIIPSTAHPAFNKACHYFGIKAAVIPVDKSFKANMEVLKYAITPNTIMLVGSAPSYPHGVIDPIEELSELALANNLLLHVDHCIGAFILPFLKDKKHVDIPAFDFSLPGVTSISADLHKYGYAAKGSSLVLYRNPELRKFQFYVNTDWPGGIYGSPAVSGSKPGGNIAAAWAALMGIGKKGYKDLADKTLKTTQTLIERVKEIKDLKILGKPQATIFSFTSESINIYEIADELNLKGWNFERLQYPPAIHLTVSQIHEPVIEEFITDLKYAVNKASGRKIRNLSSNIQVEAVKRLVKVLPSGILAKIQSQIGGKAPKKNSRTAPMYGMLGTLKGTKDLDNIVLDLLDKLNR